MTTRDMQRSIAPGSTEYGDRQQLESNLSSALSGQEQAAGPEASQGGGALSIPEDPFGALLSGEVEGDKNLPTTEGLSVGPGSGPVSAPDIMMGTRAQKIRQLAQEASSPMIRAAARDELRRMSREGI